MSKQLRLAGEYESLTKIIKSVYNKKTKVNNLHTLDSKFIKMADLVESLAWSSSFVSTAKNTMNSISIRFLYSLRKRIFNIRKMTTQGNRKKYKYQTSTTLMDRCCSKRSQKHSPSGVCLQLLEWYDQ